MEPFSPHSRLKKRSLLAFGFTGLNLVFVLGGMAQSCDPTPSGIIGWWDGDKVSGNTAVDLVAKNNLTINGGVTFVPGEIGKAFKLDGFTGFITTPDTPSLDFGPNTPFTLEGWFNFDNGGCQNCPNAGILNIIRKSDYPVSSPTQGYWIRVYRSAGQLSFFAGTSPGPNAEITVPITQGVWHHFAGTRDSSGNLNLYVDGALAGSANGANGDTTSPAPFSIGAWNDRFGLIELFSGEIDEISIYNRTLTANEIVAIYKAGSASKCKTLTLGEKAAQIAQTVIGDPYLKGGKGFYYNKHRYATSAEIATGYTYWNGAIANFDVGRGLDCSGLVRWAYNTTAGATEYMDSNPITAEGALDEYDQTTHFSDQTQLQPGDLLFFYNFDNDNAVDHVAMNVSGPTPNTTLSMLRNLTLSLLTQASTECTRRLIFTVSEGSTVQPVLYRLSLSARSILA